jgi:hypothetical protein
MPSAIGSGSTDFAPAPCYNSPPKEIPHMAAFSRRLTAAFAAAFLLLTATSALGAPKAFLASDDAKEKDEPQKFLPDYDKLVAGKDSDWVYFPKGSLKSFKTVMVKDFESNGRGRDSRDAARDGKEYAEQWLEREGFEIVEKNADIVVEGNVFNAWEPTGAARYWGGWAANPGVGLELLIKDKSGEIVGELRQKAKGSTIPDAVENGLEDMCKSIVAGK